MKLMSARPSRTASNVCAGPTTAFGSRLHLTRPCVAASASRQNPIMISDTMWCDGGTQALAFNTNWALALPAGHDTTPANAPAMSQFLYMLVLRGWATLPVSLHGPVHP